VRRSYCDHERSVKTGSATAGAGGNSAGRDGRDEPSPVATRAVRRALAPRESAYLDEVQRLLSAGLELMDELGIDRNQSYQVDDLLGGARYLWQGARNYVALDPHALPAHVFRVRRRIRTEQDFDYFL